MINIFLCISNDIMLQYICIKRDCHRLVNIFPTPTVGDGERINSRFVWCERLLYSENHVCFRSCTIRLRDGKEIQHLRTTNERVSCSNVRQKPNVPRYLSNVIHAVHFFTLIIGWPSSCPSSLCWASSLCWVQHSYHNQTYFDRVYLFHGG